MGLIIECLDIAYAVEDFVREQDVGRYLVDEVAPEINSIRDEFPLFFKTIPNQSPEGATSSNTFFDCSNIFWDFYDSPATLKDLKNYEFINGKVCWHDETENGPGELTRYLAWKVFCKFGVGDTFISNVTSEDMWSVDNDASIVDRNGLETYI